MRAALSPTCRASSARVNLAFHLTGDLPQTAPLRNNHGHCLILLLVLRSARDTNYEQFALIYLHAFQLAARELAETAFVHPHRISGWRKVQANPLVIVVAAPARTEVRRISRILGCAHHPLFLLGDGVERGAERTARLALAAAAAPCG